MLIVFILASLYGVWRITHAAIDSLRDLPHRNEDMVFF